MTSLIVGILAGAFGMAYFVYGLRQRRIVPVISGLMLSLFPWFTDDLYLLGGVGGLLPAAPFLTDF